MRTSSAEEVRLTGLALFPDDLRRVFSYSTPFTAPDDLAGMTIRAPYSHMTDAILATVDAKTVDVSGAGWEADVASGKVAGSESSLAFLAALGDQSRTVTSTAGVLFPKVNALVVNADSFRALSDQQRGMLREAAVRTRDQMDWLAPEAKSAEAFCAAGGRIQKEEDADLAALREATAGFAPPQAEKPRTSPLPSASSSRTCPPRIRWNLAVRPNPASTQAEARSRHRRVWCSRSTPSSVTRPSTARW